MERAAIVSGAGPVSPDLLRAILESGGWSRGQAELREFNIRLNLDAREKELVLGALERTRGRKKDASNLLGIDARNLGYYLRKHKLQDGSGSSDAEVAGAWLRWRVRRATGAWHRSPDPRTTRFGMRS